MNEVTASSPTESGCAGLSRPVIRKGVMLYTSFVLGLPKGAEVEITNEVEDSYVVRSVHEPWLVRYVPKSYVREVNSNAR